MKKAMRLQLMILMVLIWLPGRLDAKNLSLISQSHLQNFELLDVYLDGDLAYIPAGLGGLNIVNISDPERPEVLSSYDADGCQWGRLYAWTVGGNFAYGSGRECGIHVLDVSNPSQPTFLRNYSDPSHIGLRYEHAEVQNSTIFLSRHQQGVELVDISQPQDMSQVAVISTENAWATLAKDNLLFIADGAAGIKIVSLENMNEPEVIASVQTSGTAKDLSLSGIYLFVAVGASGVDMINVSDPRHPILMSNYNTTGYASRVDSDNNKVAVSDWDDVEVLSFSATGLDLLGYKNTGGRVMALAMENDVIYSAEWEDFLIFRFGEISGSDADLETRKIEFPRVPSGGSDTLTITLENNGQSILTLLPEQVSNFDFQVDLPDYAIPAGESMDIQVVYQPTSGGWVGDLSIESNDVDEPLLEVELRGNQPYGPMIGDNAPPFELDVVNGSGVINTDMLRGDPVVIAFFTAW